MMQKIGKSVNISYVDSFFYYFVLQIKIVYVILQPNLRTNTTMMILRKEVVISNPSMELKDLMNKLRERKLSQREKLRAQEHCTFSISL